MKKTFSLISLGIAACILQSCSGDHGANAGDDSVRQIPNYDARKIAVDTATITTRTGSATLLEIAKDTLKHTYYVAKPGAAANAPAATADTSKTAKKDSTAKK